MTRRLAEAKARAVAEKLGTEPPEAIVIGADTTVELQGRLLGKPGSAKAAREMLLKLSGKTHRVVTSVALFRLPDHARKTATESTRVRFARLSRDEIAAYVDTGEPLDKAGAYAVQGIGGRFIERIDGCYFNVVGLPLARLYRMLVSLGWQSARKAHKKRQSRRLSAATAAGKRAVAEDSSYFFSTEAAAVLAGGAGFCVAGVAGVSPRIPSLKLRMPSPIPRMTSGMRLPPNKITMIAKTISQ